MTSRLAGFITFAGLIAGATPLHAQDYGRTLAFEADGQLAGWRGGPPETLFLDSVVVHGGRYAGRIERPADRPEPASAFTTHVPRTFAGSTIELRGWLRTEDVSGFAGLWLRQDGRNGIVQFDNMQQRNLNGTNDWAEYRITLPLDDAAHTIVLGALLVGAGTLWVDELQLLVDGRPAAEAPEFVYTPTVVEADSAFAAGSGIATQTLSPVQVENLARLGRVWGFAKYHHPRVTAGEVNWDAELFRVMPGILAANDVASANRRMAEWLGGFADFEPCEPCAAPPGDVHLEPGIDWIHDVATLGSDLAGQLVRMHRNRPQGGEQYYVSHLPNVGNPDFSEEALYLRHLEPDAGYRLLALFRFWNIVEYWFPYRDVIGEDWTGVLHEFVPRLMAAADRTDYQLELMQLTARINDTHANLWQNLDVRPPRGTAQLPVTLRFVEDRAVVTGYLHDELGPATGLRVGDVIHALDGAPVDSLLEAWRPYYSASNQATRLRDIARSLTRGDPGPVRVKGEREDGPFELTADRAPLGRLDRTRGTTHDLGGATFRMLDDDVAYLKLSSVVAADVPDYIRGAEGAAVLVIDIRNYPGEFVPFALGSRLVSEPTPFALFTQGDPANPGAFTWRGPVVIQPASPRFEGRVVVLLDEVSQSQAEYTAMAFRAAGATIVGSTTAGADGNISRIPLPGGVHSMISGIGVFYPDRTPTQRVGIVPDVEVRPTIAGIRAGRDELLEAAVSHVLGRQFRLR